jgi:DNA-binding transcriptional ArsR family regulator
MLARKSHYPDRRLHGCALLFAALGNEMRLKLIEALCVGGIKSINQLALGLPMSRQNVTKHLRILASAGWVHDVKVGRERLWKFDPLGLAEAQRSLELIGGDWECRFGRLRLMAPGHSESREGEGLG